MNLEAAERNVAGAQAKLVFRDDTYHVSVRPDHFNYFFLVLRVKDKEVGLPIDNARILAQHILDITEGLDNTHDVMDEISKRQE
jgi:hypothetical protein